MTFCRLTDQAIEILKHLAARGSIWPSACAAAVRDLSSRLTQPAESSNGAATAAAMNGAGPSDLSSLSHLGYNNDETVLQPGGLNALANIPLPMPWTTTHVSGNLSNNPFEGYDIPFWMGKSLSLHAITSASGLHAHSHVKETTRMHLGYRIGIEDGRGDLDIVFPDDV